LPVGRYVAQIIVPIKRVELLVAAFDVFRRFPKRIEGLDLRRELDGGRQFCLVQDLRTLTHASTASVRARLRVRGSPRPSRPADSPGRAARSSRSVDEPRPFNCTAGPWLARGRGTRRPAGIARRDLESHAER